MNWKTIKTRYPNVWQQMGSLDKSALSIFFDDRLIHFVPTYAPSHATPWGWELHAGPRFQRVEAHYADREAAESAGYEAAFAELERLILDGNA